MKIKLLAGIACLAAATPAFAQEAEGPVTVSGSVALVSDYRFRGVSQTDEEMAIQGGFTVGHESGLYVGTWGSNLAGWGTFGGSSMELDIYGGYATEIADGVTADVGLTWFMYPGGADTTDFGELYAKISGDIGPASALVGVAYAPKQEALGRFYFSGADAAAGVFNDPGDKEDNLYLWTDLSAAVPETPLTMKGHLGYSNGNSGLGPNGTSIAPTGEYFDWMLGLDVAAGPLTLGIAYVDTSITAEDAAYLQPNFSNTKDGSTIAGSQVVFSVSAGF